MSTAKESTTLQEYFISGIVILFFGLLYLFLSDDFQFGSSENNVLPTLAVTQAASSTSVSLGGRLSDNENYTSHDVLAKNATIMTTKDTQVIEDKSTASQSITSIKVNPISISDPVEVPKEESETNRQIANSPMDSSADNVQIMQEQVEIEQPLAQESVNSNFQDKLKSETTVAVVDGEKKATLATQEAILDPTNRVFKLPDGKEITIAKDGFENNFKQAIIEGIIGKPIIFDRVYFDSGSSTLKQQSNEQISATAALLNTYKDINIAIRGHSDNKGSSQKNSLLSLLRSRSMKKALTDLDIDTKRIQIEGVGDQEPIATNKTKRGRRDNRRIDLIIKK